jgi:hypothetical protein
MSRSRRLRIKAQRLSQHWGWASPGRWVRCTVLRGMGWRCEGPFPRINTRVLLILAPGLDRHSTASVLMEQRLGFTGHWLPHDQAAENLDAHLLDGGRPRAHYVSGTSPLLDNWLKAAAKTNTPVQLISVADPLKRVRCNTPFLPGKFTERERAYVCRVFSYYD